MKIIVCIKQVPDTTEVKLDPKTGRLIRDGVPSIINPDDKNALEEALRIKDENILATPIHLRVWQQSGSPRGELIRYTEREQLLLDLLEQGTLLSLNRYCRQTGISRRAAEHLLAKFVRYDIVEPVFENHKFYFRMKNE